MKIEFIKPRRQTVWGWPAILNFTLGGAGSGFFLVAFALRARDHSFLGSFEENCLLLLAPAFVALGLLSLTLEAGRPLRARFLFANLRRSWMSREALAAAVFLPAGILSCFVAHPALWIIGGTSALGILVCQGFILRQARAIAAWNMPLIPVSFVTSGLASGAGLMVAAWVAAGALVDRPMLQIAAVCLALDALVWVGYVTWRGGAPFRDVTSSLRGLRSILFNIGFLRLVPALILALFIASTSFAAPVRFFLALSGCAALAGGFLQKIALIRTASVLRNITLKVALRNAESVAAPARGNNPGSLVIQ